MEETKIVQTKAPRSTEIKFSVKNMDLYYGDFHALKNVNIDINRNAVTAFIGPSGCGKSTLLKSLNRMNDLVEGCKISGDIRLNSIDIYHDMEITELRKNVGMVFQKPNPFPMSIYDNVAYGPRTHGIRNRSQLDEIVETSLKQAAIWDELKDRLKKSALGLSGGQQQRLCIARALAVKPEVILTRNSKCATKIIPKRFTLIKTNIFAEQNGIFLKNTRLWGDIHKSNCSL